MLPKVIEAFVPEPLVFMYPSSYLSKRLSAKRDQNFAPLAVAFDEARTFEHLEMLCHSVERGLERLGNIQKSRGSIRQLRNDRSPRRVGDRREHVGQLIHFYITP